MEVLIFKSKEDMGASAAENAIKIIATAIQKNNRANIIIATGLSQVETINNLVKSEKIDWRKITIFHLDEYIGIPATHHASFRKFLKDYVIDKVEVVKDVYYVNGDAINPLIECKRLGRIISQYEIDLALVGIGENCHLAFNDPPADFEIEESYIVVNLDRACRMQQVGEGWFKALEDVPGRAITMSIKQIMKSKNIIVSVPDKRKAVPTKNALEEKINPMCPSSILQKHPKCKIFLDEEAASLLTKYKFRANE